MAKDVESKLLQAEEIPNQSQLTKGLLKFKADDPILGRFQFKF